MRITSNNWLVVLVAVATLLGFLSGKRQRTDYTRAVDSLTARVRELEAAGQVARVQSDSAAVAIRRVAHLAREAREEAKGTTDTARAVLGDSTASQTRLRLTLAATTAASERLQAQVLTYEARLDTLLTAHLAERQAMAAQVEAMQAVIDTQARALEAGRCSSFVGRCPTRWQAFGAGVVVAIAVAVLL